MTIETTTMTIGMTTMTGRMTTIEGGRGTRAALGTRVAHR